MGKPNAFLARQQARTEKLCQMHREFTRRQCADVLMIAAAEEFGFGPARLKRLKDRYDKVYDEYADLITSDSVADPGLEYTREKVDRRLKQIMGEHFVPWEERYG